MANTKVIYIEVSEETHKRMKVLAAEQGVTMKELGRHAIELVLAEGDQQKSQEQQGGEQ